MRQEQTIFEMAEEVLTRQAKALVAQTEQPLENALEAVSETYAGQLLKELANSEHRDERAANWQASLPRKRAEERHYSLQLEGYMRQLEEGMEETRAKDYMLLEKLASLRG
jgi:hypothetical protein